MAGKWSYKRVEQIALKIAMGPFGSSIKVETFTDSGIPIISGQHLREAQVTDDEFNFITEAHADSLKNANVQRGDVIFTHAGNIGQVAFIPEDSAYQRYVISQRQFYLRCDTDLMLPEFITYYFKTPEGQHRLLANANQVGVPSIARPSSYLKTIEVPAPSIEEQQVVVRNIKTLDAKIRLNIGINQTLETMVQAIFKSWFVDFDPVKAKITAKAEGRDPLRAAMTAICGKADAELDALPPEQYEHIAVSAALFPDEMKASELGGIPEGWGVKSVADVAQFGCGKVDVSTLNKDIYISTENMLENRGGVSRAASIPSVATVPCFKTGQILVSNIRPYFKKIWMAHFDGGRSPDVLAFEPTVPQSTEFLYNLMYQDAFFEFMTRTAKGAKMPRGDKDAIMGWRFPCPDEALLVYFAEKVRPHYEYINSLKSENDSLAELRDTLLPKLLSGELSVTDAMVEAEA